MSTATVGTIPQVTLGWRLQMALGHAGIKVQDMAAQLGVNRGTLTRWMHDVGAQPKRAYLLQWALSTGVDPVWLETGVVVRDPECPRRDSNAQPSDYSARVVELRASA